MEWRKIEFEWRRRKEEKKTNRKTQNWLRQTYSIYLYTRLWATMIFFLLLFVWALVFSFLNKSNFIQHDVQSDCEMCDWFLYNIFADEIEAHAQKVRCLDLGETGRVLVTGGQDRNVNLWAFGNDKRFMVIFQLTNWINQIEECVLYHAMFVLPFSVRAISLYPNIMGQLTVLNLPTTTTMCIQPTSTVSLNDGTWMAKPVLQHFSVIWKVSER